MATAVTAILLTPGSAFAAPAEDFAPPPPPPPGGAPVGVGVNLPGMATPYRENRCDDRAPYTQHTAEPLQVFETESGQIGMELSVFWPTALEADYVIYGDGQTEWVNESDWSFTIKTKQRFRISCIDPETDETDPSSIEYPWVSIVNEDTIVLALTDYVADYLDPPTVSFPSRDLDFDWLYVNTPQDIRIATPSPLTLTATVTNETGTATASLTATPKQIVFTPGEPDGTNVACSIAEATAPYSPEVVGCHYVYKHSSAISPSTYFGTRTLLVWTVTTTAPAFQPIEILTVSYDSIQVAEIQALVTS